MAGGAVNPLFIVNFHIDDIDPDLRLKHHSVSDEGNKEDARRWTLVITCPNNNVTRIPMQVYAVLKPMEGRLKKAPRRVVAQKRRFVEATSTSEAPILAALPQVPINEEQNDIDRHIELYKLGCANKARRIGLAWIKAMIKAQRIEGDLPPED